MPSLSTEFILRLALVVWVGLLGSLRVRGDMEQLKIWLSYGFPPRWMPLVGASQMAAVLLALLAPQLGVPAVASVAVLEGANHVWRQGLPAAAVMDAAMLAITATVTAMRGDSWLGLIAAAGAGGAAWYSLNSAAPRRLPAREPERRRVS